MKRRKRALFSLFALVAIAFAQFAVTAHACLRIAAPVAIVEDASSGCCPGLERSNECAGHCQYGSASVDSAKPLSIPSATAGPPLAIVAAPAPGPAIAGVTHPVWPTAGPPPTRLFALRI